MMTDCARKIGHPVQQRRQVIHAVIPGSGVLGVAGQADVKGVTGTDSSAKRVWIAYALI